MSRTTIRSMGSQVERAAPAGADWWQPGAVLGAAGLTIALWALTPVTTRIASAEMDGVSIGLVRTIGAGVLAAFVLLAWRIAPPSGRRQWALVLLSAAGSFAIGPVLFSFGTAATSASHAALIMASMPLFAGIIAAAMDRQWPSWVWCAGAGLALVGEAALIGLRGNFAAPEATLTGDIYVLIGCIAWAGGFVAGAQVTKEIGPWRATFWALVLGSVALSPLAAVYFPTVRWGTLSPLAWVCLAHISLGASLVAYICWFWAMARGGIARVAVLQFAQAPLALVFAVVILAERVTVGLAVAAIAIVAGIVVARRR